MLEWRSPLAGVLSPDGSHARRPLCFAELRGWSLTHVGVFPGCRDAVSAVLTRENARVYAVAPDQRWVVSSDLSLPERLASAVPTDMGTVTSLTHSRIRIAITGPTVRQALGKVLCVDLRESSFRIGDSCQTGLHHVGVLVERSAAETYEMFLPRTFARTLLEVLRNAG